MDQGHPSDISRLVRGIRKVEISHNLHPRLVTPIRRAPPKRVSAENDVRDGLYYDGVLAAAMEALEQSANEFPDFS